MNFTPEELRDLAALDRQLKRESFNPSALLFDKQRAVWEDPARFITVDCSRRSGKTDLGAVVPLWQGLEKHGSLQLYVMPTLVDCRDTIWGRIRELNAEYGLGYVANEVRLNLVHPRTKSEIRFRGAADEGQAQHLRGPPHGYDHVFVDEAQNYGGALKTAIGDAILPAMTGGRGVKGKLWVMGTPSLVRVGFWFDLVHRDDGGWSHHHWTLKDNPHLQDIDVVLAEAARSLGGQDAAAFRREWLGEWVADPSALVFSFNPNINYFDELPQGQMQTVIGVDLGHHPDASAIDVEGWFPGVGDGLFGVEEWVQAGCDLDDVADALEERIERYKPVAVVIDEGGLGKLIAETMRRRRQLPVYPAEKTDKLGAIGVLNTDLRAGRLKVRRGSRSAHDMATVRWDEKARDNLGKLKIAAKPHSDILDAKLYAHRRARHYLYASPPPPPPPEPDLLEAARLAQVQRQQAQGWMENDAASLGLGWERE